MNGRNCLFTGGSVYVRHDSLKKNTLTLPDEIDSWLKGQLGQFSVLADASWPRPNSRVWRVRLRGRDAFVKISPDDDSFRREQCALTTAVPRSRIDAPALIAAAPELRTLVMSEVPGQVVRTLTPPLEPTAERDVHHRAGVALAALHRQVQRPIGPVESAERLDQLLSAAVKREAMSGSVLARAHIEAIGRARAAIKLSAPGCALTVLHGDFQPRNWLWSRRLERLALIDFEAATRGFWVEDLAWLFATTWSSRPDLRESFLQGYGAELSLPDELFLAAFTVLGSLEHLAAGVGLGISAKVENGLRALETGRVALDRLQSATR